MKKTWLILGALLVAMVAAGCNSNDAGDPALDTAAPAPGPDADPNPPRKDPSVKPPAPPTMGTPPSGGQ